MRQPISSVFLVFHILVIVLFGVFTEYDKPGETETVGNVTTTTATPAAEFINYNMFQDVHVMIAIGFGFLMAFLYRNSFTTIGHSFLCHTFVAFWAILNIGFWHRVMTNKDWDAKIQIGIGKLIEADFAAGAVLISFGALVGRCSAEQLLVMAFCEVIFFGINEALCVTQFMPADVGGSMIIHTFGAYFGVACSFALEAGNTARAKVFKKWEHEGESNKVSDTFAMIGALFLWCFWPSFNGALAGDLSSIVVVNTYLAICASCLMSFYITQFFTGGKFNMVEVQNASLAGGVGIGAVANMQVDPWGAILIGTVAGALSVVGYQKIKLPIRDTCGVHNLHGMPGVMSGIASIITAAAATSEKYTFNVGITPANVFARLEDEAFDSGRLARFQLATLACTLAISIGGGLITGAILRTPMLGLDRNFVDTCEWAGLDAEEEEDKKTDAKEIEEEKKGDVESGDSQEMEKKEEEDEKTAEKKEEENTQAEASPEEKTESTEPVQE